MRALRRDSARTLGEQLAAPFVIFPSPPSFLPASQGLQEAAQDAKDILASGFVAVVAKVLTGGGFRTLSWLKPTRTVAQLLERAPELQAQTVHCLDHLFENRTAYHDARERFSSEAIEGSAAARLAVGTVVAAWGPQIGRTHETIEETTSLLREARELLGARGDDEQLARPSGGGGGALLWDAAKRLDESLHQHLWPLFVSRDMGYPLYLAAWEQSRERTPALLGRGAVRNALSYDDSRELQRAWKFLLEETARKDESTAALKQRWLVFGAEGKRQHTTAQCAGEAGGSGGAAAESDGTDREKRGGKDRAETEARPRTRVEPGAEAGGASSRRGDCCGGGLRSSSAGCSGTSRHDSHSGADCSSALSRPTVSGAAALPQPLAPAGRQRQLNPRWGAPARPSPAIPSPAAKKHAQQPQQHVDRFQSSSAELAHTKAAYTAAFLEQQQECGGGGRRRSGGERGTDGQRGRAGATAPLPAAERQGGRNPKQRGNESCERPAVQ